MWSDDYYHQQLDDIYARMKREDEYEAKQRKLEEVRSTLPVLSEPQIGETDPGEGSFDLLTTIMTGYGSSPGRPANVKPLHPLRTPTKKTASARNHHTASPLGLKSSNRPLFSRPPGRTKLPRLSRNSLLPGGSSISEALRRAAQDVDLPLSSVPEEPEEDREGMTAEETEMANFDFERWVSPTYRLRLDEAMIFRDLFNDSEVARARRLIFWLAPDWPLVGNGAGNPRVSMAIPVPVPSETRGYTGTGLAGTGTWTDGCGSVRVRVNMYG